MTLNYNCVNSGEDVLNWATASDGDDIVTGDKRLAAGNEPDTLLSQSRKWSTPIAANPNDGCDAAEYLDKLAVSPDLGVQIVKWKTPTVSDSQGGCEANAMDKPGAHFGLREMVQDIKSVPTPTKVLKLNPRWVEELMGLPVNWVNPNGDVSEWKGWPMGMGREQHPWEAPRIIDSTYTEMTNRESELRMLGNGCVPQQVEKAFKLLLAKLL